jgi:hypothetical protein
VAVIEKTVDEEEANSPEQEDIPSDEGAFSGFGDLSDFF